MTVEVYEKGERIAKMKQCGTLVKNSAHVINWIDSWVETY